MLGLNRTLTTLSLRSLRLADESAQFLADALRVNTALTSLDLGANRVRAAGAQALADVLADAADAARRSGTPHKPPLKTLELGHNALGDEGAAALATAVAADSSLAKLSVAHCGIRDAGLAALAKACLAPHHLEFLGAWGNDFGMAAAAAFRDVDDGDHDVFVDFDFRIYEVDGKLRAAATEP